jgi:FAD:protein FMN transferase
MTQQPDRIQPAFAWQAMGTTWRIFHDGDLGADVAAAVAEAVEADEQRWSRFRDSSELAYLNRCAGMPVEVSAETLAVLERCDELTAELDGVFAPLVGAAVVAWGYAVSRDERPPGVATSPAAVAVPQARLVFDAARRLVRVPAGAQLDLGGIAKTWSCVRAAGVLCDLSGEPRLLVEAGGDLVAARGSHVVAIEDPRSADAPALAHVVVAEGHGICTSGWNRRSWTNGDGVEANHLIDPSTGTPAARRQATVIAPDPVRAEVLAKVLVLQPERLAALAEPAIVVDEAGAHPNATFDAAQAAA